MLPFAPGSCAEIRDQEWLIRRVDPSAGDAWLLTCHGISDLLRGQSPVLLTDLKGSIEVLDPAKIRLVPDTSPTDNTTLLYLESWCFARVAIDLWIKAQSTMLMDQSDD